MRRLLARSSAVALLWTMAACGGGGSGNGGGLGEPPPQPPPPSQQELDFAQDVLDLVNEERASRGLDLLVADPDAAEAAYGHAYDMDARNFFSHVNPSGENPGDRLDRAGASWSMVGENIAQGQETPDDVMAEWMSSPDHRDNILHPDFTRLGVGVHVASGGPWWVQVFFDP
jgi:uncharacterized protein YkwD